MRRQARCEFASRLDGANDLGGVVLFAAAQRVGTFPKGPEEPNRLLIVSLSCDHDRGS